MAYKQTCKVCHITLSEFEVDEYKDTCIDCYREKNQLVKVEKPSIQMRRTKRRKYILTHHS